jgi:hypothetical protein
MDHRHQQAISRRALVMIDELLFSPVSILVVGLVVIASLFLPWQLASPRVYRGFDQNLLFPNPEGAGQSPGLIRFSGNKAVLTATPLSNPTIHLVDSESDFAASFDVTPLANPLTWQSVSVTVQPPAGARYYKVLVAVVGGVIQFHRISIAPVDSSSPPLSAGTFDDDFSAPSLNPWLAAPTVTRIQTAAGTAMQVSSPGAGQAGTQTGTIGPLSPLPKLAVTAAIATTVGHPKFNIAMAWLDAKRRLIKYAPDWPDWSRFSTSAYVPVSINLWYPSDPTAVALQFSDVNKPTILIATTTAKDTSAAILGEYVSGNTYHVDVSWHHGLKATFRVTTPATSQLTYSVERSSGLAIFNEPFVNLSIAASPAGPDTSSIAIANYQLTIPSETRFATNVSDSRLVWLTWIVVGWFVVSMVALGIRRRRWPSRPHLTSTVFGRMRPNSRWLIGLLGLSALGALCILAAQLDGHPFDHLSQGSAAYVIGQYGLGALYGRTSAIPDAIIRGGTVPWNPAEFVYPPGLAYFFVAVAEGWRTVIGAISPMGDRSFYVFWKVCFAAFILVDTLLVYAVSNRTSGSRKWALIIAGAFALNPATIFDAPIWGQSNALLLAPVLAAILSLLAGRSRLMWTFLVISLLTKQTALLMAPFIAIFALRQFGLRRTFVDGAFGVVSGFVFISPFILAGYSPATAIYTTVGKLVDFGTPFTNYTTQVSADTFPIWVLFTGFAGLHGHDRLWASDHAQVAGLTYATAGLLLYLAIAAIGAWGAWRAARLGTPGHLKLFGVMAMVIVGYVSLNTRTSGHYLTLAIPFLLLCLPRSVPVIAFSKVAVVATSAVISMYGLFMFIAAKGEWPNFAGFGSPSTNVLSGAVYSIYTSDLFITLFAAALLYVLIQLVLEVTAMPANRLALVAAAASPPTRAASGR